MSAPALAAALLLALAPRLARAEAAAAPPPPPSPSADLRLQAGAGLRPAAPPGRDEVRWRLERPFADPAFATTDRPLDFAVFTIRASSSTLNVGIDSPFAPQR